MAFSVYLTPDGSVTDGYGDEDIYKVTEAGVLIVTTRDENRSDKIYSVNGWVVVSADKRHGPGGPAGDYDVAESVF